MHNRPCGSVSNIWGNRLARKIMALCLILGITVISFLIFGHRIVDRFIYQPPPACYSDTPEIIKLTTSDGSVISARYYRNPWARYTILISHGNAEDIGSCRQMFSGFYNHGFSVFAYDYHGYGTSQGKPGEQATYADIQAAYDYLVNKASVDPADIILFGRSLGSGPATDLAARHKAGGLVIESGFTSALQVVTSIPIPHPDRYRNIDKIGNVHCPVLVIHGIKDRLVNYRHGRKLFDAANQPKMQYWVEGAGHNDVMTAAGKKYWETINKFIELLSVPPRHDNPAAITVKNNND